MEHKSGANRLRSNVLGVGGITFLVISAAAPLTAIAGGVPLSMLLGNGAGVPAAFLLVTIILLLFAVGYLAMARHIHNAGAFYAFTAQGLGGLPGGAAATIAILAYNCMQIGLFGLFGAATAGLFAGLGLDLPWWVWTYIGIAIVGYLGYRNIDLSTKILAILVLLEYLVVVIIDTAIFIKGGDSGLALSSSFTPAAFFSGTPAIGILFCFAAFIGFEATTIYSEEARSPNTTIPRATYLAVLTIGGFYMLSSWLIVGGVGADKLMPTLQELKDPTTLVFGLAERYVGAWVLPIMNVLFVSSLFAGALAFHNSVARYIYVAGRDRLLWDFFGKTHDPLQSPHVGSVSQTLTAILVVALFAVTEQDPVLGLFSWLTNVATLAILVLMFLTSIAVVVFFGRNPQLESNKVVTKILPSLVSVILLALILFIVSNFAGIAGANGALAIFLPSLVVLAGGIGIFLAMYLRSHDLAAFNALGKTKD